jgi:lysophospholipase L1-like esterase
MMLGIKAACWTAIMVVLLVTLGLDPSGTVDAQEGRWVTAWGSSLQGLSPDTLTNATVQMIARPTIPGDSVRVKLENTFSAEPLTIGAAYVALRNHKVSLVQGLNRQLTFNGLPSVTIPAAGRIISDPVVLTVEARQDLAVSLYVPGTNVPISRHTSAYTISYLTPNGAGNHAASEDRSAFTVDTTSMYWLSAVEVFSSSATSAIIAFGDSITNGTCSTAEAYDRWEDVLAVRLSLLASNSTAVVNEGISGNTLTRANLTPPPDSPPGIERLDRDVLEQAGVTHVILFMGTNDIDRGASAAQVIAGMQEVIDRVKAVRLKIIGVTIIPRHNQSPTNTSTGWNDTKTAIRNEVNSWIRDHAKFDAIVDFDEVVRDAANPNLINPIFNCDGIHPNSFGYFVMGQSIDMESLPGIEVE